ncbi:MAG TPA: sigma-54 dependent transcriptional regulator [Gammaproteobacteria bacterium]
MNAFEQSMKGSAPEFRALLRSAQIAAATDVTVLLLGESGTGKELLAHAMHAESPRHAAPFVAINCAALPESLAESELFGHRKGAFTGAVNHNPGRIRSAEGGTLFLDEVGELPLNIQAKLLRFLESGECQAVGETCPVQSNVRIIAATHRDLYEQVQRGAFREDLYYRLNVVPLELPPLRQRCDDIPLLLEHLISELAARYELEAPRFSTAALTVLRGYRWPGNVRELRNFCERMVVLLAGREIQPGNLPREMQVAPVERANPFALPDSGLRLEELEQSLIRQALDKTHGNRSRAARLLGLSRDTLLYRLKKYAIG